MSAWHQNFDQHRRRQDKNADTQDRIFGTTPVVRRNEDKKIEQTVVTTTPVINNIVAKEETVVDAAVVKSTAPKPVEQKAAGCVTASATRRNPLFGEGVEWGQAQPRHTASRGGGNRKNESHFQLGGSPLPDTTFQDD